MKNIMLATRVGGLMALVSCLTLAQNSPNVLQADAPKITIAPLDHKVPHNSRVTFFCKASGHPAPTISWYKGDKELSERRTRYISTMDYSSALTLESVGDKQSGVYQCVANNGIESPAVANATLSVYQPGEALPEGFPVVSELTEKAIILIERGFPMALTCTVTGDPEPQIIWYKDKAPVDIHSSSRVVVATRPGVPGSHDLRVSATELEDAGEYVCMGKNEHGTVYSSVLKIYVKVRQYAPRFTIRPDVLYNVMAGGNLNITCVAVGSPMPYVRWIKDGERLGEPSNAPIGRNVLELLDIRESVNYTCYAQSILGTIFVKTQVKVQALPGVPENAWVKDITSISAKLMWTSPLEGPAATGQPEDPSFLIQFRQIFTGDEVPQEWSEQGEDVIGTRLSYTLNGLQPFTIYEAAVVPFTQYGRGTPSAPIQFKTEEAAPESAPYDVKAKAVSENTALIQWKAPMRPNGDIEGYRVFYCLASQSDQPIESWSLYPTVNNLAVLDNLITDEEYSVSVQARNRIGTGPASQPIQFTVTPGVPLAPSNLQVTAKTATSLTLAWARPTGTDSILSYEIYINNSRNRQTGQEQEGEVRSVIPPQEEYVLEDLFPNTVYNIKITARSTYGEGPHSSIIQVKTNEAEPSAPPLNIQAEPPNPDAAFQLKVVWEPPPSIQANGEITGYKIYYIKDINRDDSTASIEQITDPAQTSFVIDSLEVWTKYRIWMKASTSIGDSPPSQPVVARTGETVPDAPKSFSVLVINSTAVLLQWKKLSDREARGEIRGYQIFQSKVGTNGMRIGQLKIISLLNGSAVNHTISGLNYSTKYVFQIRAFTVAGDGAASVARTIVTPGAVPTAPLNLNLEIVDQEPPRIRVTWEPPMETHGQLTSYRLMWGKRHEDVLTSTIAINSTRKSYIAVKIMKGTEYEFQLQARNEKNYGEAAVAHIRTEDGVPSGSPQNITATYHTDTSAVVSWRELDPALRNGVITMYQVRIQDESDSIDLRAENTSETSIIIEDLKPGHKYLIQVVAYTSAGAGPTSYRALYNTQMSRPPAPLAVTAKRKNGTVIKVTWQAPPRTVVRGYKIHYSTQDLGKGTANWESATSNQPTPNYLLTGLDPLRAYAIKVQAIGTNGEFGLFSEEAIVNDVIPSNANVRSLTGNTITSTAVHLSWAPPSKPNPSDYRIDFVGLANNSGKVHEGNSITLSGNVFEKTIDLLKPGYNYTFEVLVKYEGDSSYIGKSVCSVTTKPVETPRLKDDDVAVIALSRDENDFDEIYVIVALTSETRSPSSISLFELQGPSRGKRAVDEGPYIAGMFSGDDAPTDFTIGDGNTYGDYTNKELSPDSEYKAFVRVVVAGDEFSSSFTKPFTSSGPVTAELVTQSEPENKKVALVLGPIGSGVVIIVIIVIIVIVIRRNKTHKKEDAPEPTKVIMDQPPVYPNDPVELRRVQFSTPGMQSHPPIPVLQLSGHIEQLRAQDNLKFSQEYESIEPGQQYTWDNSNLEYNKPKNRYANVIAYDHSRVVLQPMDGAVGSDYINANYMDGYRKQNAYISTQGPLPETFGDFWRMVWEQRSATIVMMTRLEERSRLKCDTYWPLEGTEAYGPIIVTLTDCMELATYTVRTFQIERDGWAEKREVRQFQFTAWPDHGVPDYPTPLLIFMKRVKTATPSDSGPMIVHCSAGVGRTGAFIVIDAMLERIKHEKTVDIYGHVTCLRAQRNYMVQTEDQYIFIHDALLEAVLSGNTEIHARNLYTHIQKLAQPDGSTTSMDKEFKSLSNVKINPSRFASANLPVNKFKNRLVNVLPYEANRVCLLPIRGVDGSDYINASFIDGYRFKKAYIATQGPLADTVEDFWRMIWEHNSTIIVMLTKTKEMGREKCHQYWPETRSARYQYFVVDPHAEYSMPEYTLREFKVTDARDGQSRTIRLFQFNEWPEQGQPQSGLSFIQFIGQVHKTKEQFGQEGPITVHCSAGVGRTGVFISLSIILERMRYEGVVDMFQTVKMLRTQRQGMVQTVEQYAFCYQAALEHLASFDHY